MGGDGETCVSHRAPLYGPGAGLGLVALLWGCVCDGAASAGAVPNAGAVCSPCRSLLAPVQRHPHCPHILSPWARSLELWLG